MAAPKTCTQHAFHVDRSESDDRWHVVDDAGRVIGHCHDRGEAITFAICQAQRAHGQGDDVVVCVEQPDGGYTLAWSPP